MCDNFEEKKHKNRGGEEQTKLNPTQIVKEIQNCYCTHEQ